MECEPTDRAESTSVATPPLKMPVPSVVVPSLKTTLPVGVPLPDVRVTVAVNVTLWPKTLGLVPEARTVVVPVVTTTGTERVQTPRP